MAQERQKVMAAGFDGFQGKPISVRELLETVRGDPRQVSSLIGPRILAAVSPEPRLWVEQVGEVGG